MKKILFLSALISLAFFANAQTITPDVVSGGGDYFSNSNYSIAWTVGEPVIETLTGTNYTLTQGFHQGIWNIVNVEKQIANTDINVYPNPTSDYINIDITGVNSSDYQIQLFDNLGNLLLDKSYEDAKQISLQKYARSLYYVKVLNVKNNKFDSYKILKK